MERLQSGCRDTSLRLEHTGKEGNKPRTRASGKEQGGKKAASGVGTSRIPRTDATDWYVRGTARRQEGVAQDWNILGMKDNSPGLHQPGVGKKEEPAIQIPLGTRGRAGATGGCTQQRTRQGWGVWGTKTRSPGPGRQEGGPLDYSIWGKQVNSPVSTETEHGGGANKVPTPEEGSGAKGWSSLSWSTTQECKPQDWSMQGKKAQGPGLD